MDLCHTITDNTTIKKLVVQYSDSLDIDIGSPIVFTGIIDIKTAIQ